MRLTEAEKIVEYLDLLSKQAKALKEEAIRICWLMRGGISLNEAFQLSFEDREIIGKLIEENMELTKKTGQMVF